MSETLTPKFIETEQGNFAYLQSGSEGPLALCLHGFPDTAFGWRHVIEPLAAAGYRVVAPFMRGYAPTPIPQDGQYFVAALAADAIALHKAFNGSSDAILIGHDWGALAAYSAAAAAPDCWHKVVTAAVPPPAAMAGAMLTYTQLKRSWYMFFFQVGLSDFVVGADDLSFIDSLWKDWSPGYDATEDMKYLRQSLGAPENLAAALGYYRATWGTEPPAAQYQDIAAAAAQTSPHPTLYLHGKNDGCIGVEFASADGLAPGSRCEVIDGAGHFLQVEQPEKFLQAVLNFINNG